MRGGGGGGGRREAQGATERRAIRSHYLAVKNLICDEREDIARVGSDRFRSIFTEVENLQQMVQKPREQVADAEALLDIANTLITSVRSHTSKEVIPSDFVTAVLTNFGKYDGKAHVENSTIMVSWADIGLTVSHVFRKVPGCCTMVGPMKIEMKQHKVSVYRRHARPTQSTQPEELVDTEAEWKTDTDKNMSTMFSILRKKRSVRLENLVLNRSSFAQTVENIFTLSFLVKDGRAEISVNQYSQHLVSPRNAPAASSVSSREVAYSHFVFRFDFKDWKLMRDNIVHIEESMPHRTSLSMYGTSQAEGSDGYSQSTALLTPIRKLTLNGGLVIQQEAILDDLPQDISGRKFSPKKKCRLLFCE